MTAPPRRSVAFALSGVAALGLLVSCSGGPGSVAPTTTAGPPSTTTTSTTTPDYSTATLAPVPGATTLPSVAVTPGPVAVSGTVVDDTGAPVAAATVSLERIVGNQVGTTQVTTAGDGSWQVQGILGGLYRIRAWLAPNLAQPAATVVFLATTTPNPSVALKLSRYGGTTVQTAVAPNPPILGEPADIVVQVSSAVVGSDGIIHNLSQPGVLVALSATGQWSVDGNPEVATSTTGEASWQATCEALGVQALAVTLNGGAPMELTLPACSPVPTTTTAGPTTNATTTTVKG